MYVNKQKINLRLTYATEEYSDRLFVIWLLNLGKVLRIKKWFSNECPSECDKSVVAKHHNSAIRNITAMKF